MSIKEKIIRRLNEGFGFSIPLDATWMTHQKSFVDCGGFSWYFDDVRLTHLVGACVSATECLRYDKWAINLASGEIFELTESERKYYEENGYLLEGSLSE